MHTTRQDQRSLTLTDIARLAGVSRSAASRALDRNRPVAGPGADRVRAVAAEHGYVPNAQAANLRRQRSGHIAVVVPRLTDTVMAMLYEAVAAAAADVGLHASVVTTGDDPRTELERGRAMLAQRIDGFVVTTSRSDGADPFLLELAEQRFPHVLALRTDGSGPSAVIDDFRGGVLATQHLIEHGHRRVAYVGGPTYASTSAAREAGYRWSMEQAGLPVPPELVQDSDFSVAAGVEAGERLLALARVPTAVFTANDSLAVGLATAASRAGVLMPRDLSVVGYNDTPLARHLPVPLTSVAVPFDDIARNCLDLLARAVDLGADGQREPEVLRSVPHLVRRTSVAPPREGNWTR